MRYAGFWPRLGAILIDCLVFAPIALLNFKSWSFGKPWAMAWVIVGLVLWLGYTIGMLAWCGQTIGKMVMGIRVTMLDGSPITLRAAFLRHSVDVAFGLCMMLQTLVALSAFSGGDLRALQGTDRMWAVYNHAPTMRSVLDYGEELWFWSELVVLWFNPRRRAIHDFIAGTLVVHVRSAKAAPAQPDLIGAVHPTTRWSGPA